jgi:nucleoside 2-deoxyribosyltransferase
MRDFLVYLAGPISGLTFGEGQSWREYAAQKLPREIRGISPLRAKGEHLVRKGIIQDCYEDNPLTSQHGITSRDRYDCMRSDAVLMNLLGAKTVSIGTMIEVGWTDAGRIPLIVVMEKEGNLHNHAMLRDCASYIVHDLNTGLAILEAVLMPEGKGTPRDVTDVMRGIPQTLQVDEAGKAQLSDPRELFCMDAGGGLTQ